MRGPRAVVHIPWWLAAVWYFLLFGLVLAVGVVLLGAVVAAVAVAVIIAIIRKL